jgi:uracil-DNA glycosylase
MDFTDLVNRIRAEKNLTREVPGFDPQNGNEKAKFLFLLEAPGPKAVISEKISLENPDPSARNLRKQLETTGITRDEIAIWNIVPWFISNEEATAIRAATGGDVREGIAYLEPLVSAMPNLRCIVLVGGAARKAHVFLSHITSARIVGCHHTSAKVINTNPDAEKENLEIFRFIKESTKNV